MKCTIAYGAPTIAGGRRTQHPSTSCQPLRDPGVDPVRSILIVVTFPEVKEGMLVYKLTFFIAKRIIFVVSLYYFILLFLKGLLCHGRRC